MQEGFRGFYKGLYPNLLKVRCAGAHFLAISSSQPRVAVIRHFI
jgi:hypothetical protein